jgi:predicted porin
MNVHHLLAFTAFALAAGVASAQKSQVSSPVESSSVTLFGIIDVALSYGTGSAGNITQLTSGRSSPSRWGVRGFEDLGGGLTAGFWLESQINMDTGGFGTTNVNNQPDGSASALFSRRATVSLISSWGEVRLGRDFTASFRNRDDVDPFGTSGVGANLVDAVNLEGPASTRASNMVGYFLPANLGGFFGEAQYYMGENVDVSDQPYSRAGDGYAARLGWAGGNFAVAVAGSRTNQAQTTTIGDVDAYNVGASYDFQVVKVSAGYYYGKIEQVAPFTATGWLVGAVVPIGATQLKMSYSSYGTDVLDDPRGDKLAVGAVYSLSKRTSLYGTYAYLRNSGGASYSLNNAITETDRHSSGFDLGIKHTF